MEEDSWLVVVDTVLANCSDKPKVEGLQIWDDRSDSGYGDVIWEKVVVEGWQLGDLRQLHDTAATPRFLEHQLFTVAVGEIGFIALMLL